MIPELVGCFDRAIKFMQEQVADLSNEEMTLQPPGIVNHAAWTFGHVIYSCQAMAGELGVEPWLPENWESSFGYGSSPNAISSEFLDKTELSAALEQASQKLRTALLGFEEEELADPLPDEESREIFPTKGHALVQVIAGHTAFHAGQLTAWRRAIGRKSVGVFI